MALGSSGPSVFSPELEETVLMDLNALQTGDQPEQAVLPEVLLEVHFDNILDEDRLFDSFYSRIEWRLNEEINSGAEGYHR